MNCAELTHSISADLNFDLPAICSPLWGVIEQDTVVSLQHWLDLWIRAETKKLKGAVWSSTCRSPLCNVIVSWKIQLLAAHRVIYFEVSSSLLVEPSLELTIPSMNRQAWYALCGIVYLGSYHFSCQIFDRLNVWTYDGRNNDGVPLFEAMVSEIDGLDLSCLNGREAHIYIYRLQNADQFQT